MRNIQKLFRIFLDSSVLLSGLNSPFGASAFIISLFKLNKINIVISPEVILEVKIVIKNKFPNLLSSFQEFLISKPEVIKKLTSREIKNAYKLISSEDAPILAGAIKSKVDYLITLDKKFRKLAQSKVSFKILSPGDFVRIYKQREEIKT